MVTDFIKYYTRNNYFVPLSFSPFFFLPFCLFGCEVVRFQAGLNKIRSQLVAQFMQFSSAHSAYFNISRQKVPYFNVSRQNRVWLAVRLSLALSGSLWLSVALRNCSQGPCSARLLRYNTLFSPGFKVVRA